MRIGMAASLGSFGAFNSCEPPAGFVSVCLYARSMSFAQSRERTRGVFRGDGAEDVEPQMDTDGHG